MASLSGYAAGKAGAFNRSDPVHANFLALLAAAWQRHGFLGTVAESALELDRMQAIFDFACKKLKLLSRHEIRENRRCLHA